MEEIINAIGIGFSMNERNSKGQVYQLSTKELRYLILNIHYKYCLSHKSSSAKNTGTVAEAGF